MAAPPGLHFWSVRRLRVALHLAERQRRSSMSARCPSSLAQGTFLYCPALPLFITCILTRSPTFGAMAPDYIRLVCKDSVDDCLHPLACSPAIHFTCTR